MAILFILLVYLSILRLIYFPIFFQASSSVGAAFSILLAFYLTINIRYKDFTLIIVGYSVLLTFLSIFLPEFDLITLTISYLETITPYLVIGAVANKDFMNFINSNFKLYYKSLIFLLLVLLSGHFLNLIGFPLPSLVDIPLASDLQGIFKTSSRINSFVGTPGPYAICVNYIFISLQILNPNLYLPILIFGSLVLIFSFSRLALFIFLVYNIIYLFLRFLNYLNSSSSNNLKIPKNYFLVLLIAFITLPIFINRFGTDIFSITLGRFSKSLSLLEDTGNIDRLNRFSQLVFDIKENNFMNFIIGDGTGRTSKSSAAFQGESQLGKIYVEWGMIGVILVIGWLSNVLLIVKYRLNKFLIQIRPENIALFFAFFFNLLFIQAFTSAPIFISMIFPLISLNRKLKDDK